MDIKEAFYSPTYKTLRYFITDTRTASTSCKDEDDAKRFLKRLKLQHKLIILED